MNLRILALSLALTACVPAERPPADGSPAATRLAQIDVEKAVIGRFGRQALDRARSGDQFIAVLRYPGLPVPDHDTDGRPITPAYPTALLFHDQGQWFAYGASGLHPVLPRWSERLDSVLRTPGLWAEPVTGGAIGCTDAGASYAWLRVAGQAEHTRIGHCGGSPITEELVSAALMG